MPTQLIESIATFIAAVNRHDEQAVLDAFTIDGFVDDWGRVFTGRDAIKGWSDKEFVGAEGTMTVVDFKQDGKLVAVTADWRSNWANGLSKFTFWVMDGRVSSMTIREG